MRSLGRTARVGWILALLLPTAQADILTEVFEIDPQALEIERGAPYDLLRLEGGLLSGRAGEPAVPGLPVTLMLPERARVIGITATALETHSFAIGRLEPVHPPVPLSRPTARPVRADPDPTIYAAAGPFPAALTTSDACGHGRFILHPLQYHPREGRLDFHTRMKLVVEYASPAYERTLPRQTSLATCEYAIITTAQLEPELAPLAEWKTRKGIPTEIVLIEEIAATQSGRDLAEQVRNFLKTLWAERGLRYVLLAGAPDDVSYRTAWAMDCEYGGLELENLIPADLYFSDLDGSWDANGNGIFGETTDEVDLYPEIYVGRAPVHSSEDAAVWVAKILTYEQTPPSDYLSRVLMCAELSFEDPYTDDSIGMERLAAMHFGAYDEITKLYESQGNESRQSVLAALNAGQHFAVHYGHGSPNAITVGHTPGARTLTTQLVDGLTNGTRAGIFSSVGCWAAAYDQTTTVLGQFLRAPEGGACAIIGNTRYGWAAPGNPGFGYSERVLQEFYGALLTTGITQLGAALAEAKMRLIPYSRDENVYRWHQYCVTLLGDPEMQVYTNPPESLAILAPEIVPPGEIATSIVVQDPTGPVGGARVCISGSGVPYQVGYTNEAGGYRLAFDSGAAERFTLVATLQNHRPASCEILVADSLSAYLSTEDLVVADAAGGNGDGEINPGETVLLAPELWNRGAESATNVGASLTCEDAYVEILDSVAMWASIPAGEGAPEGESFTIAIDPTCPPGHPVAFTVNASALTRPSRADVIALAVVQAEPLIVQCRALEVSGDGDGLLTPGEVGEVRLRLYNAGSGTLAPGAIELVSDDPFLELTQTTGRVDAAVAPGDTLELSGPLIAAISPWCPAPFYGIPLAVRIPGHPTEDRWTIATELVIGLPGFADDMEAGAGEWETEASGWQLSQVRAHSGSQSWYAGNAQTGQYDPFMEASLLTPRIALPPQAELSFWRYLDVAIYGVDGAYVEVKAEEENEWTTLDFFGTGGALGPTGDQAPLLLYDWAAVRYPLEYPAGTEVRFRFRFISDSEDQGEGFYIDDLAVTATGAPAVENALFPNVPWPNPFTEQVLCTFSLAQAADRHLAIYDTEGRLVRTLVNGRLDSGGHAHAWNGRDERGQRAHAGVYFMRLAGPGAHQSWRIIKLQ